MTRMTSILISSLLRSKPIRRQSHIFDTSLKTNSVKRSFINPMRLFFFILIIAAFVSHDLTGQNDLYPEDDALKGVIYRKELAFDTRLHTNGFAFAVNFGDIITYKRSKYYQLELGYLRDPREQKQTRNIGVLFNSSSNSFKLGKQNNVFTLRGGVGRKKFISNKARRKGIAIGYSYEMGPSIAILKPYYLQLQYDVEVDGRTRTELRTEKYSPENADKFLDFREIYGSAGFSKGLRELTFIPGAQAKAGLFFSLGAFDEYIKSVEVGLMADVFIKKIPIMVETESISNKPYFINLYLHLQLGKRSN